MFVVMADNYIDESYYGWFDNAWDAFLFGIACHLFGRSMGVDIYHDKNKIIDRKKSMWRSPAPH